MRDINSFHSVGNNIKYLPVLLHFYITQNKWLRYINKIRKYQIKIKKCQILLIFKLILAFFCLNSITLFNSSKCKKNVRKNR